MSCVGWSSLLGILGVVLTVAPTLHLLFKTLKGQQFAPTARDRGALGQVLRRSSQALQGLSPTAIRAHIALTLLGLLLAVGSYGYAWRFCE